METEASPPRWTANTGSSGPSIGAESWKRDRAAARPSCFSSRNPGAPSRTGGEVGEANVSVPTTPDMLDAESKWFRRIGFSQAGLGWHDRLEGGRHHEFGIFRPTSTSMMREPSSRSTCPESRGLIIEFPKIVDPTTMVRDENARST